MREVLCRGKSKRSGEWKNGYLVKLGKESFSDPDRYGIVERVVPLLSGMDVFYNVKIEEVDPETVGQWIGFLDCKRKPICEGDLVKFENSVMGTVVYAESYGYGKRTGFYVDDLSDGLRNLNGFWHLVEVVGNIHDNCELSRGENK